ncbi:MAG: hypothetical protein JEZ03_09700 [Bacteroidales bacterium]|nr:hypothetical protein [Bacteroidales bacterium]
MNKIHCIILVFISFVGITNAQQSKLIGKWQLTKVVVGDEIQENLKAIFIFENDGVIKAARSVEKKSVAVGTWEYHKMQNAIVMHSAVDKDFRGEAAVIKLTNEELIYEKEGAVLSFIHLSTVDATPKIASVAKTRITLDFVEQDFFTEDGDYLYDGEEQKLPWQDFYQMLQSLRNVQHLVYNYATLIEDTDEFENKILTADVKVNDQEESLSIDYIFYGYDHYNLPEDAALPPNTEYSGLLYPERDNTFRVSGTEQITTVAGTFECTVIEMLAEFDVRKKLWMINDKPGVYAKIIEYKPGDFGHYAIYELLEIK